MKPLRLRPLSSGDARPPPRPEVRNAARAALALALLPAVPATALESVTLQLKWRHAYQFAGYYMAVEKGYYQDAGLQVDIREGRPGIDYVEEVVAGRAHYGTGSSRLVLDRNLGKPVVALAVVFQHSPDVLLTARASGLATPQQLVGRQVMLDLNGTPAVAAMLLSEAGSLDKFRILPQLDDLAGLMAKRFDGIAGYGTDQPFFYFQHNFPVNFLQPIRYGVDFYGDNLFTTETELRHHPARVKAFRAASLRGWEYAMQHPEETIPAVQRMGSILSTEHLRYEYEAMQELILPFHIDLGLMNRSRWKHIADTYVQLGQLHPGYRLDGFLYDPDPTINLSRFRRYLWAALAFGLLGGGASLALWRLNRTLKREIAVRQRAEAGLAAHQARLEELVQQRTAELSQKTHDLQTLLDHMPAVIGYWDRDLRNRFANSAHREWFGIEAASLPGRRLAEVLAPDLLAEGQPLIRQVLAGEPVFFEHPCPGPGGTTRRHLEIYLLPDLQEKRVAGFYVMVLDITRIRETEEALRTAKNAAEAATVAKTNFLSNMSHEIRTPLNAILNIVRIVEHQSADPEQRRYLGKIEQAGRSLLMLINDILDLSRIEAGRLQPERAPFALGPILDRVGAILSGYAIHKRLDLSLPAVPAGAEWLWGDSLRLEQVLINLAGNAVKFTEQGSVGLELERVESDSGRPLLRFTVRDTGIGIAPEQQGLLFSAFSQADASTTRRFGGSGLGLAISRRLVELMGGDIGVDSAPGQGSRFWFTLPFEPAEPAGPPPVAAAEPGGLPGLRLLVVDDDEINREVAQAILEEVGAQVTLAVNGREALTLLEAQPEDFDGVLMDVQMPVMDGYEAVRAIRRNPAIAGLPVIALSAGAFESQRGEALAAGMDAFIGKPFEADDLIRSLQALVPPRRRP